MKNEIKNKHLLVPYEEVKREILNTPEKRRAYKREYKKFVKENKSAVLRELGTKVKSARNKAGVTQGELARKLKTTRSTISRIEKGEQNLTVEYIIKVARALGRPFEVRIY